MAHEKIEAKVENLVKPIIQNLKYDLYDVQYVKEGKDYFLRIMIDKPGGISIEDCENVNNAINDCLDEADFINTSYFLEVSSPGIERILRKRSHFEKQIGNRISLKLFKAVNSKKELEGILKEYHENELLLQLDDQVLTINISNIAMAKTVAELF